MRNNKKGFTLIELLAVIVILAIIALIATPIILNIVEKARKSAFQDSAYGLIEAAKLQYVEGILDGTSGAAVYNFDGTNNSGLEFSGSVPEGGTVIVDAAGNVGIAIYSNGFCAVKGVKESTVRIIEYNAGLCIVPDTSNDPMIELIGDRELTLKVGAEYTEQGVIAKTMGGSTVTYVTTITKAGSVVTSIDTSAVGEYKITYETVEINGKKASVTRTVNVVTHLIGEEVTFDPGDGVSTTWNVLADNGDTVTLILNQNLGESKVAWYSSKSAAYGPVTALETLNTRTSTWTNVDPISSYEYENSLGENEYAYRKLTITNGETKITTNDQSTVTVAGISRARLITVQEVLPLVEGNSWNQGTYPASASVPAWMVTNLVDWWNSAAYWTLTSRTEIGGIAWIVFYDATIDAASIVSTSNLEVGIRPVIEIPKSKLAS